MNFLAFLGSANFHRYRVTTFKVLLNIRLLALIGVMFFIIFSIGGDTVLKPNLDLLKKQDERIQQSRLELSQKELQRKQTNDLQNELKNLTTKLIPVPAGNSPTVVAVSESAEILRLAKGSSTAPAVGADQKKTPGGLPKPHDTRENVTLTSTIMGTLDVSKALQPVGTVAASSTSVTPPGMTPGEAAVTPNPALVAAQENILNRFDYDLKATGTYPALMDLLNSLVLRRKLIKINKVVIVPSVLSHQDLPNAADYPDFPVKLDMTVSLSLFLYAADESPKTP